MRPIAVEQDPVRFPLSHLLGTAAHVRLIRVLADEVVGPITAAEAAERAGLTETGARKALSRLSKTGFVRRVGGGRAQQYELREGDPLTAHLAALFGKERERFEELLSSMRGCFENLSEVQYAWVDTLPQKLGGPLEVNFVSDPQSLSWLSEEVRRRILQVETRFDLIVEVRAFTRAEAPTHPTEDCILIAGVLPSAEQPGRAVRRSHSERDQRALRLSQAIASLLEQNPSLIRRALRHLERILKDDQGSASHDLQEWHAILSSYSPGRVGEFLTARTSRADRLRQSSPFFAVLSAEERDSVLESSENAR